MSDTELELLLKVRRQQPAEWDALDPTMKLEALNYEARVREEELLNEEKEKSTARAE